jgi:hypothetical protein
VIRLEEKRMTQPPALGDIENELRNYLLREKFQERLTALRGEYPVEIVGQPAPADAAPAATEAPAEGEGAPPEEPAATDEPATEEPAPN